MKESIFALLHTSMLVIFVPILSIGLVACNSENVSGDEVGGPEDTTSEIAVTGLVDKYGCTYADISGYANLNLLPMGSGQPVIGVELVEVNAENNENAVRSTSSSLIGNIFTVSFSNLAPETEYKYRSFVTYGGVTYYGNKYKTFTTKEVQALTSAAEVSDITITSAVLSTSVQTGGVDVRDDFYVGLAWSISEDDICPGGNYESRKASVRQVENSKLTMSLSGLPINSTYYCASFTLVGGVCVFSSVKSFTTVELMNLVGEVEVSDIKTTFAVLSASVQTDEANAEDNVSVGFAWSTSESDLCASGNFKSEKTSVRNLEDGVFTTSLSGLSGSTTYYYASFTLVGDVYVFSSVKNFTTADLMNLVAEVVVSDIKSTCAVLSASVLTEGVDVRDNVYVGFAWSTSRSNLCANGNFKSTKTLVKNVADGVFTATLKGLPVRTSCYCASFTLAGDVYVFSSVKEFATEDVPEGAVDLGLSVLWASCNVGADSPEEYGDYFAWGETTTKWAYDSRHSLTFEMDRSELKSYGIIDSDGNLTAAYDAATVNCGGNWRMPTLAEMKELKKNCSWSWTTQNGVEGYKVIGPNGNIIFLPAAGDYYSTWVEYAGSYGNYWSATADDNLIDAYRLNFYSDEHYWNTTYRYYGFTVRPVSE